jgi:hypothetical protein
LFEADRKRVLKNPHRILGKKQKTVTRTFRISAEWDDVLRNEAESKGISVNVLVNLILRKYALFDRWTRNYTGISLTQQAFHDILDNIPLENLASAGEKTGAADIQNILGMIGLPSNYDSFVYLVSEHFGGPDYAMWFSCYRHFQENRDFFHLQHILGRGWSVYVQKYLVSYLKTLDIDCESQVYDYAVNIKVPPQR